MDTNCTCFGTSKVVSSIIQFPSKKCGKLCCILFSSIQIVWWCILLKIRNFMVTIGMKPKISNLRQDSLTSKLLYQSNWQLHVSGLPSTDNTYGLSNTMLSYAPPYCEYQHTPVSLWKAQQGHNSGYPISYWITLSIVFVTSW